MRYHYFPGCSVLGTGRACEESTQAVIRELGVELKEIDDWNCCGATAYMSVDEHNALALAARNIALAEKEGATQMTTPCSGCYLVLNKTKRYIEEYPTDGNRVKNSLRRAGLEYKGNVRVRHMLDIFVNDVGLDTIRKHVKFPMKGVKVAAYYGCQTVRPFKDFDQQHFPTKIDELCEALGAEPVHFPLKTRCCGGSQMGTLPSVAQRLVFAILREAKRQGANLIVSVCPLCHFNLDSYQTDIVRRFGEDVSIPCMYYTQLMGLAFGIDPDTLGLYRNLTWDRCELRTRLQQAPVGA
jgi:heterodisulfide reductase subunit B